MIDLVDDKISISLLLVPIESVESTEQTINLNQRILYDKLKASPR